MKTMRDYAIESGKMLGTLEIIKIKTNRTYSAELNKETLEEINQMIVELLKDLEEQEKGAA
jgi:hypothetical protein